MTFSTDEIAGYTGKRILVVALGGGMGDLLLSSIILKPLKAHFLDSSITVMIRKGYEDLFDGNEYVTGIFSVENGNLKGKKFKYWLNRVRESHFDIAIVLWNRAPEAFLLYRAGIPIRVGSDSRFLYSFLYTHKVRVRSEHGDTTSHWTEIICDYIRELEIPINKPELRLSIPFELIRDMNLRLLAEAGDRKAPFFGVHFCKGMQLDLNRWPTDYFADLINKLGAKFGGTFVFVGTEKELPIVEAIISKTYVSCLNMAGKTSLRELAALSLSFSAFLSSDSGPGHVAAIIGTPTISLFPMKSDFPNRWRPWGDRSVALTPEKNSCPLHCVKENCPKFDCYRYITAEQVSSQLKKIVPESILRKSEG